MKTRAGGCSYSLHEPTQHTTELYVKIMKKAIPKKLTKELISAFEASSNGSSVKVKASTLANAVQNIAEPYFYDQSYANGKTKKSTILLMIKGNNSLRGKFGYGNLETLQFLWTNKGGVFLHRKWEKHPKTHRPPKSKCTSEFKHPTKEERQRIVDLKSMFDSVRTLRRALDAVDSGCQNCHYKCSAPGRDLGDEPMIRDLAGHPLMCTITGCESKLRTLREAASHYPMLQSFLTTLYEAIRSHKMIASIDSALRTGKYASLALWCGIKDYRKLFSSEHNSNSTGTNCASKPTVDIQMPNLPDVESVLQVKHAQMIAELEKKRADDPEFACCSCERLLQRKSVTAFDFSENKKFTSNKWQVLRAYMYMSDPEATIKTHYVTQ